MLIRKSKIIQKVEINMAPRHVHQHFHVVEFCGNFFGFQYAEWNDLKCKMELNFSRWTILRSIFSYIWMVYLCLDAFYYTLQFGINVERIYIVEIPFLAAYATYLFVKLPSLQKDYVEMVNIMHILDKMIFRYYKRNKYEKSMDTFTALCSVSNVFIMVFYFYVLMLHFKYPFCKMYTLQYLCNALIFGTQMIFYISKAFLINRLAIINDFIKYDVTKRSHKKTCELCKKCDTLHKSICGKHKIT